MQEGRTYRLPPEMPSIPLMYSLRAHQSRPDSGPRVEREPPREPRETGTPVPYVYAFDHRHKKPPMEMKDLLGGKGANLAEMTSVLGLPVPPGFTISTDACRDYMRGGLARGPRPTRSPATRAASRRR